MATVQIIKVPCPKCRKVHKITSARYVVKAPINCDCGTVIELSGDMSLVKTKSVSQ